jgi:hypothetical protein
LPSFGDIHGEYAVKKSGRRLVPVIGHGVVAASFEPKPATRASRRTRSSAA